MVLFYHTRQNTQVCTIPFISTLFDTKEVTVKKTNDCPVSTTLDMIGGKYKALILWHLSDGTLRYTELRKQVAGATPKMLTQQLRELENDQLIHREVYAVIPPKVEYSLTELGKSLLPILVSMRDWGAEYLKTKNLESDCFMMNKNPIQTN